ncbi:hypothetical protein [Chishuiella sp.]|uniref:hypothetical protein n=1 Tax=Chishuiella sp. TaxID=1969467 RepID=UPI0028A94D69|nr:hypothetical protein [Chishuiella sp.]
MKKTIKFLFTFIVFIIYHTITFGYSKDSVYITGNTKIFIIEGTKTNFINKVVKISPTKKITIKKKDTKKNISKIKKKVEVVKQIKKQTKPTFKIFISKNNLPNSISILDSKKNVAIQISYNKIKSNIKSNEISYKKPFEYTENIKNNYFLYQEKYIDKFYIRRSFSRPLTHNKSLI